MEILFDKLLVMCAGQTDRVLPTPYVYCLSTSGPSINRSSGQSQSKHDSKEGKSLQLMKKPKTTPGIKPNAIKDPPVGSETEKSNSIKKGPKADTIAIHRPIPQLQPHIHPGKVNGKWLPDWRWPLQIT